MSAVTAQKLIAAMKSAIEDGEITATKTVGLHSVNGCVDFEKMAATLNGTQPPRPPIDYGDPADMWPPRH